MCRLLPLLLVLPLTLPLAAAGTDDDPEPPITSASELRKLRGTWTVTHGINNCKEVKPARLTTYTFEGNTVTIKGGPRPYEKKVKIDTRKRPFTIEVSLEGSPKVGGIYKVENGKLFLALKSAKAEKPPTTFDGNTGRVLVMTRGEK